MKRQEASKVGDILEELLKVQHLDTKLNETKLIQLWPVVLGESIARYTTKLYINRRILYVQLSSSIVRNELMMCREKLIKTLNEQIKASVIDNIIFR